MFPGPIKAIKENNMGCPLCNAGYKPVERSVYYGLEVPRTVRPKGNRKERSFIKYCWKRKYELRDIRFQQFIYHVDRKHGFI